MNIRRILSIIVLLSGLVAMGMTLFADSLGLDDHSGWSRTRILGVIMASLLTTCSLLYLAYQTPVESAIKGWRIWLDQNSLTSRFLNLSDKYFFTLPIALLVILVYIWLVSSGTWTQWVSPTRYYADLARGFANGNLFMAGKVDPRLS